METKILAARQQLKSTFGKSVGLKTEVLNNLFQVQATLFIPTTTGDYILSTGYSYFESFEEISSKAKEAMIDAIKNFNHELIK